jgi:NADH-quinone oxidoreductase subunit J
MYLATLVQWFVCSLLIISSLGVILLPKPVHASLSFLLSLLLLAALYLELSAHFIAVLQVFVYAGAILVIFMFVIILFQDAHAQISRYQPKSAPVLLIAATSAFVLAMIFMGSRLSGITTKTAPIDPHFGTVEGIGQALYVDYFFPFEAVILLFLVALVGALYIGRKDY